jgi:hypothetical protein
VAGKVRQEKCDRKIALGKLWKKNCDRKSVEEKSQHEKCSRKTATEKVRQKNCGSGFTTAIPWKKKTTRRKKRYGSHMCSAEFINQVEGFPCKYVGCPLGSLWLLVELI